jgi:hypothetical protein
VLNPRGITYPELGLIVDTTISEISCYTVSISLGKSRRYDARS